MRDRTCLAFPLCHCAGFPLPSFAVSHAHFSLFPFTPSLLIVLCIASDAEACEVRGSPPPLPPNPSNSALP